MRRERGIDEKGRDDGDGEGDVEMERKSRRWAKEKCEKYKYQEVLAMDDSSLVVP